MKSRRLDKTHPGIVIYAVLLSPLIAEGLSEWARSGDPRPSKEFP